MYTTQNFKTKKALKEAVKAGEKLTVFQPNDMFGKTDAAKIGRQTVYLEGPHYPKPHTWYAQATVQDGIIVAVK